MNNIINLTKMSFLNLKAVSKQMWIVWVIWIIIAINNPLFLNMLFGLTVYVTLYNVMAYEDINGIDNLIASIPVKRHEYVISRYLVGIVSLLIGVLLALAIYNISPKVDPTTSSLEMIFTVGITSGVGAISAIIPMVLRFGINKGRMFITIISMLIIMIPSFVLEGLNGVGTVNEVFNMINRIGLPFILVIFNVLLIIISIFICIRLYSKKEIA